MNRELSSSNESHHNGCTCGWRLHQYSGKDPHHQTSWKTAWRVIQHPPWVQCTEYTQPILSFRTFIEKNNTFLGAVVFLRGQKTKKKGHQLQIWSQHQKLESQQFHLHILSICCHVSVSPLPGPKGQAFFQKKTGTCNGIVRNAEEHPGTFSSQSLVWSGGKRLMAWIRWFGLSGFLLKEKNLWWLGTCEHFGRD